MTIYLRAMGIQIELEIYNLENLYMDILFLFLAVSFRGKVRSLQQ